MQSFCTPVLRSGIRSDPKLWIDFATAGGCTEVSSSQIHSESMHREYKLPYFSSGWFIRNEIRYTDRWNLFAISIYCYTSSHCHTRVKRMNGAPTWEYSFIIIQINFSLTVTCMNYFFIWWELHFSYQQKSTKCCQTYIVVNKHWSTQDASAPRLLLWFNAKSTLSSACVPVVSLPKHEQPFCVLWLLSHCFAILNHLR